MNRIFSIFIVGLFFMSSSLTLAQTYSAMDVVNGSLNVVDASLNVVDASLNVVDTSLDVVDAGLNVVDQGLQVVDAALDNLYYTKYDILYYSQDLLWQYADVLSASGYIVNQANKSLYRIYDGILRQEAVGIATKFGGRSLPDNYACRGYFSDVSHSYPNNWACRAIEIAADYGIVTKNRKYFNPTSAITRVEALAMLMSASGIAGEENIAGFTFDRSAVDWQKKIILKAYKMGVIKSTYGFYPNRPATRGDIFYLAYLLPRKK